MVASPISGSSSPSTGSNSTSVELLTAKILIADDSNTDRLLLETILRKQNHSVVVATNGIEAVEVFQREAPSIVLLDALMPVMDGFEAAKKIKALAGEEFVPVIFLTSLQAANALARCLDAGGDDFLSKPYNSIILQAKINAFLRMKDMHRTLQYQRDEIARNNARMLREQEVAKRVFDKVAHAGCLDAPNIQYALSPIAVFNGDVVLAGVTPGGSLAVLLGDFTGHGLDAGIGAMPLAQTFYSMLEKGFGVSEILREINKKLHEILPVGVFCCALVAEIDFKVGSLSVWNGGLPDCLIYRSGDDGSGKNNSSNKTITPLKSRHLPLGIRSNQDFNDTLESYEVAPGDRLYVWSDGIHEAENANGDMYGEARLLSVFEQNQTADTLFREINQSVESFIGEGAATDDLSLLEVKVVAPEQFSISVPENTSSQQAGPGDWNMSFELRPDSLRSFDPLPLLLHILMQVPFLRPSGTQIYTVLTELYSNALEHGVLKLDSSLKDCPEGFSKYYRLRSQRLEQLKEGLIVIQLQYKGKAGGGRLGITIEDSGCGFDYQMTKQTKLTENYCGRGVHLVRSICSSVDYSGAGNRVCAVFLWGDQRP